MARFFLPPSAVRNKSFTLAGSEAHHAVHVLRKKVGDEIDLFDGKDASFRGRIDFLDAHEIRGTILENLHSIAWPVQLNLYQALTRGSKWEWLLEKACEVGVARLIPVTTQRSLIKLDAHQAQDKSERWNRIALAACKQCGRSNLMEVALPVSWTSALKSLDPTALSLIPWEKETERSVQAACAGHASKTVNLFIGPEGGWDGLEIDQAQKAGVIPVRLGPTLLRTETAGLIASTLVLREFGIY